ncbi:zinc finger, LSD1 subclass family protein, putative, partial (macronuclear) [Tetrahymena thermophila SB210]
NISPCHPTCQSCDGPLENNCLSCAISSGASGPVKGKCTCNDPTNVFQFGICLKTCDSSKFLFESNKICVLIPNCLQNVDSQCQKCKSGYYLADGQCFTDCPAGYQQMPNNNC